MAVATKSSGVIPVSERVQMLQDWIKSHDKEWWVKGFNAGSVVGSAPLPTSQVEINELAAKICTYWQRAIQCKRESTVLELDDKGWDAIRETTAEHVEIKNEPDATFEFCLKFLLSKNVQCSRTLLLNSSAFHRLTKKRFKHMTCGGAE